MCVCYSLWGEPHQYGCSYSYLLHFMSDLSPSLPSPAGRGGCAPVTSWVKGVSLGRHFLVWSQSFRGSAFFLAVANPSAVLVVLAVIGCEWSILLSSNPSGSKLVILLLLVVLCGVCRSSFCLLVAGKNSRSLWDFSFSSMIVVHFYTEIYIRVWRPSEAAVAPILNNFLFLPVPL